MLSGTTTSEYVSTLEVQCALKSFDSDNKEAGYAEALVGVDSEWLGIRISALPREREIIEYDPSTDP